jgi:Tol biopolymer transport system component
MRRIALALSAFIASAQPGRSQAIPKATPSPVRTFAQFSGQVKEVVPELNGRRVYYVTGADELWLYDVGTKKAVKVASGAMRDVSVSLHGDLLAFTRRGDIDRQFHVWTMPLDSRTGMAMGPAQRASVSAGDNPAISSDSKWIVFAADTDDTRLTVIPSNGGAERTVARAPKGIDGPVWSVDGRAIYYGTGFDFSGSNDTVLRVPAGGGKTQVLGMTTEWDGDLSPDGVHLGLRLHQGMSSIADAEFVYGITDIDGKLIGGVPGCGCRGWLSASELFSWYSHRPNALLAISLADGASREILPAAQEISEASWAPDGKTFAAVSKVADTTRLLIADASGGRTRTVYQRARSNYFSSIAWSADGRSIVMESSGTLVLVDVVHATSKIISAGAPGGDIDSPRWTADARHVRYILTIDKDPAHPERTPREEIREASVDGGDALVRRFEPWLAEGETAFVSDTTVVISVSDSSAAYTYSLTSGRMARVFSAKTLTPSVSPRGDLLVMRTPSPAGLRVAQVVTPAGTPVATVTFPGAVGGGVLLHFLFAPDGKNLIASGRDASGECCSVYVAPLNGGPVKRLLDLKHIGAPRLDLSPDGKTLLVTTGADYLTEFKAVDISGILRASKKP